MSDELETYRHSSAAFELPLPRDWERAENMQGCALIAVERTNADRPPVPHGSTWALVAPPSVSLSMVLASVHIVTSQRVVE